MFWFEYVGCVLSSIGNLEVSPRIGFYRRPLPPPPPRPPHPPPPPKRSPPPRWKSWKRWLSCPPRCRFWASRCMFCISEDEPPPARLYPLSPERLSLHS